MLQKIHQYLQEQLQCTADEIASFDSSSVYVAMEIAMYAHRDQARFNGENHFGYVHRILQRYRDLVGIVEDDYFCLDVDLLVDECNVPYEGMQELCLLQDVVAQTDVTMDDVQQVFDQLGLKSFFLVHIKPALEMLSQARLDETFYVANLAQSQQASIVKFLSYADEFDVRKQMPDADAQRARMQDCVAYCRFLDDKWGFLQNVKKYFQLKGNN
ncbi:MAG: hypothetical protein IKC47_02500 [Clostridia bacterium]|nr:hypothetical protein [Clostridia bacterium]